MNPEITFNIDKDAAQIYVMMIFPTEVSVVWDFFTKSELLDWWWAPKPWKTETFSLDFFPNGKWHYAMIGPEGDKHYAGATFNEINQHRSFDYTDYFTDEKGNKSTDFPEVNWLFGFTGVEEGTKLTINIHHKSPENLQEMQEMGFEEGFKQALNQLYTILSQKDPHR